MEKISINTLNEFFKNKNQFFISEEEGHQGVYDTYEGVQCEYNESFKYYKHPDFPDNVFFRETYHTDSYGSNNSVVEYTFVKGIAKTITVYEPF